MFIDTHTHLFAKDFKEDIDIVLAEAMKKGVERFYLPNIDVNSIESLNNLSAKYPDNCFPMMGLHPCSVKDDWSEVLDQIEKELRSKPFVAIGEMGLDFHWDLTHKEQQLNALRRQIEWAKELKLPIVLHTRKSFDETYEIVQEMNGDDLTGVFHCFGGSVEDAHKVAELGGFYLGIGGVVTFKNGGLDKIVAQLPLDYLVLETDSPYLAPTPFRGKRNESTYIPIIAQKIADVKEISLEDVAKKTTENALKLFGE